jgi:hypothetical protein
MYGGSHHIDHSSMEEDHLLGKHNCRLSSPFAI